MQLQLRQTIWSPRFALVMNVLVTCGTVHLCGKPPVNRRRSPSCSGEARLIPAADPCSDERNLSNRKTYVTNLSCGIALNGPPALCRESISAGLKGTCYGYSFECIAGVTPDQSGLDMPSGFQAEDLICRYISIFIPHLARD